MKVVFPRDADVTAGSPLEAAGGWWPVALELSRAELTLLSNAIMESLGYGEVFGFQTFAGSRVHAAEHLWDRVRALLPQTTGLPAPGDDAKARRDASPIAQLADPDTYLLTVSGSDVEMLRGCLSDSLRGVDQWEFQLRLGSTPQEAEHLELQLSAVGSRYRGPAEDG